MHYQRHIVMNKIVGQIWLSSLDRTTSVKKGKGLNSKPEECYWGQSLAQWCTILLL